MRFKLQAALRKFFSLPQPTPHQTKSYYVSGTKILLRRNKEIYRHLLSKCFKNVVLGHQEMIQCKFYFLHQIKTFAGKFVKSERVLTVLQEQFLVNVKFVEIRKMSEVF